MNKLRLVEEEYEVVFADHCLLDLVPLHRHALSRIDLHDNLLAADFVREPFEQHLALFKLCDAVELHPPEKHVKAQAGEGADEPPNAGNPDVAQANYKGGQRGDPSLPPHDLAESKTDISLLVEFVILRFYNHTLISF